MQLKKDLKEEIMLKLVTKAASKHGPAMGKAAEKLDNLFRALVTKHIQAAIPELPPTRWVEMLQAGMMTRFSSMEKQVYLPIPGRTDGAHGTYFVGYANAGCGVETADFYWLLMRKLQDQGWSKFLSYAGCEKRSGNYSMKWLLRYTDLPGMSSLAAIDRRPEQPSAWTQDAWSLHEQASILNNKFLRVLEEAKAFYEDLEIIFAGIRTAKQLTDQFPEAAKLLPPPPPKRQEVAPKELIDRAMKILETGIPD